MRFAVMMPNPDFPQVTGPFDSQEAAVDWSRGHVGDEEWVVVELCDPLDFPRDSGLSYLRNAHTCVGGEAE